jgi:hypothetical protein
MALATHTVRKQDLKNREQYSSAGPRRSFATNYVPHRDRRRPEMDIIRSGTQPRIKRTREDVGTRFVENMRAPRTAEFRYSGVWQAWSRPAGLVVRSLDQVGEYSAIHQILGFDKYVESADKNLRSLGMTVRHSEANSLSTEELFSKLHHLNSLSENRDLTTTEFQQMSDIQRELDERESSEPGPAAALAEIEADLARLDRISEILRLLSALE